MWTSKEYMIYTLSRLPTKAQFNLKTASEFPENHLLLIAIVTFTFILLAMTYNLYSGAIQAITKLAAASSNAPVITTFTPHTGPKSEIRGP